MIKRYFKTWVPGRTRARSTHPPVGPLLLRSSTSCHLVGFEMRSKTCWIIAGATSAIAAQFALVVAARGDQLILLARDAKKMAAIAADCQVRYQARVDCLVFDALAFETHRAIAASASALAKHPINLLVAFGTMSGSMATIAAVNFSAVASVCDAFMPIFQAQNRGSITIIGSVSGDRARAKQFAYSAAKAALVPFCEGLQAALKKHHVSVTLMKPGYINTPMTFGMVPEKFSASPLSCAKACLKASDRKVTVQYFPRSWRWIMLVFRWLPKFVVAKIS